MNKSESIKNIAIALAKFNNKVHSISKDAKNPFFKSDYVTLDTLIKETRSLLSECGLSVMQFPEDKEGMIGVKTLLLHESGEYIEGNTLYLKPAKNDPQAYGSAVTYARRYSYQAILGLATGEDDDGNNATENKLNQRSKQQNNKPNTNTTPTQNKATEDEIIELLTVAQTKGFNDAKVEKAAGKKLNLLTSEEVKALIERLNKK